jgi:hypothetical protein
MTSKSIDLGKKVVGQIQLPKLDVSQYIGTKVKIESIEEFENSFPNKKTGKMEPSYSVKFTTSPVATLPDILDDDNKPLVLRASKFVGLQMDKDGRIGWGADTKMGIMLAKYGVDHYNKLKGKEVIAQIRVSKEGQEFLTF